MLSKKDLCVWARAVEEMHHQGFLSFGVGEQTVLLTEEAFYEMFQPEEITVGPLTEKSDEAYAFVDDVRFCCVLWKKEKKNDTLGN